MLNKNLKRKIIMISMTEIEKDLHTHVNEADIHIGDTVRVHVRITEGEKTRIQVFEGTVIRMRNGGHRSTFTVRKVSFGVGVERIFPIHSPWLAKVEIKSRHQVRRAKLYYLRDLMGKKARLKEIRS